MVERREMTQRFTQSEKKKMAGVIIILIISFVTLFVDFSVRAFAYMYVVGIVALTVTFETYIYFTYVSERFRNFSHATLYIRGAPGKSRTCVDVDGKFVYKLKGEFNGAALRLPRGIHDITVRNGTTSTNIRTDIADNLTIFIDIRGPTMCVNTEYREQAGEETIEARRNANKRMNIFLFSVINVAMLIAVLRILTAFGILK